jgi:cytochrome c-type biogenesis protein CcmH/NrfG
MKALISIVFAAALLAAGSSRAAGGGGPTGPEIPADPVIEKTEAAIANKNWAQAQDIAREGITRNPRNPDYHNLYAYSIRMGANPQMDLVFLHYNEALRLDPEHRGAHEYLGEAYLMTGNLEKAKEHLKVLDRLCTLPCREYSMLKKSVAEYEAKQAPK